MHECTHCICSRIHRAVMLLFFLVFIIVSPLSYHDFSIGTLQEGLDDVSPGGSALRVEAGPRIPLCRFESCGREGRTPRQEIIRKTESRTIERYGRVARCGFCVRRCTTATSHIKQTCRRGPRFRGVRTLPGSLAGPDARGGEERDDLGQTGRRHGER